MTAIRAESYRTILVADPDEDNRILVRTLGTLKGYRVLEAISGEEAFSRTLESNPALLMIDLRMPGVSGIRVIRRLREKGVRQMPIIATSSIGRGSTHSLAIAAGCVAHIMKPIEPDQLEDLLDQFLPVHLTSLMVH